MIRIRKRVHAFPKLYTNAYKIIRVKKLDKRKRYLQNIHLGVNNILVLAGGMISSCLVERDREIKKRFDPVHICCLL